MADADPCPEEWRRGLAREAFNGAWDLIDLSTRTADEDRQMLVLAAAARYLWDDVGGDQQRVVGDWQIAHALSWLGEGSLALRFAEAALDRADRNGWVDWRKASCLEGMARAHAVLGHASERDRYAALFDVALGLIEDLEERELIGGQLATVPGLERPVPNEPVPDEPVPDEPVPDEPVPDQPGPVQ